MFVLNRFIIVLSLLLAGPMQAWAMTVYDVVQLSKKGYTDQGIIELIETTDSAFELDADDIPRLMELGVGEPVIQFMLSAVPAAPPPGFNSKNNPAETMASGVNRSAVAPLPPRIEVRSEPMAELGAGHHEHQLIALSGIRLFVLRDEAGFRSVSARARAVADRLRNASAVEGKFQPAHVAGRDAVTFTPTGSAEKTVVLRVSAQDAIAYQRRSGRPVSADLLTAFWSDLLTDYWAIALSGRAPEHLAMLHEGEALLELFEGLDRSIGNDSQRLSQAFRSLPQKERDHLLELAVSVPRDFIAPEELEEGAAGAHEGESL